MALKTKWLIGKTKSNSCTMTGVWRAVEYAKGCAVIFHSPLGCMHVAGLMDMGSQYRVIADEGRETMEAVPLVSSNMREKDGIFGGVPRLHDCISYVMKTYHPECILIASSCVAGVIGDDVDQEAEDAEAEYGIPVMAMAYSGFLGGEYSDGYYKTTEAIIRRFFKKQTPVKGRVLLLGDQMGPWGQYAREMKRLLSLFGLDAKYQFPGFVPFKEWPDITTAEFSVLLGTAGQPGGMKDIAKLLETEYGMPILGDVYPVGWDNTKVWIRALADFLHEKEKGEEILAAEEKRIDAYVKAFLPVTEGKKAVIGIGRGPRWYHPRETLESLARLHMKVEGCIFFTNLTEDEKKALREEISSFGSIPILNPEEGQPLIDGADILLTTNEVFNTETKQLFIPMVPMTGTEGEMAFLRGVYRLLLRYGKKGGVAYVSL